MDNMFILRSADSKDKPLTKTSSITISTEDTQSDKITSTTVFEKDFNRIQIAAARLVAIQEIAKRKGSFSAEDNRIYGESLLELGQAAQNLANLQKTGQIKDFSLLLQSDFQISHKQPLLPSESLAEAENLTGEQKVDEVTEQQFNEEDFLPPNTEDPYEDVSDTVAVTAPKKDASVAEAKPIGLSIAGEGGVASSKPNAIALSGRNGLAVSAPKATAIAGVSAEEAAAFSVSVPNRNNLVIKTVHSQAQGPLYDDYNEDYSEVVPLRSTFSRVAMNTRKYPPPDVNKKAKYVSGTEGGLSDSLINKWRTMVAEDYSASTRHL
uniref:DUF4774 domain-containing protein n=2 Tax=Ceratitis capitata TaxID=7213 RepID=W8BQQ3_CERCA